MNADAQPQGKLWKVATWLAYLTIFYNLAEGIVSVFLGLEDEALTLLGFGIDSFIEVLSGVGILVMVFRIRVNPESQRSGFERTALRITGAAFYLLGAGLVVTVVFNLLSGRKPETTLPGLVISLVSLAMMGLLVWGKRKVGRALSSAPILADANCTMVCIYMSLVLLASSLVYHFTGFGWVDSIGSLGLVYFSVREGKEAFEKAASLEYQRLQLLVR